MAPLGFVKEDWIKVMLAAQSPRCLKKFSLAIFDTLLPARRDGPTGLLSGMKLFCNIKAHTEQHFYGADLYLTNVHTSRGWRVGRRLGWRGASTYSVFESFEDNAARE